MLGGTPFSVQLNIHTSVASMNQPLVTRCHAVMATEAASAKRQRSDLLYMP